MALVTLLGVVSGALIGTAPFSTTMDEFTINGGGIHFGEQPPYALTPWGHDRVELVNREYASDPTWDQLVAFLIADNTDQKSYDPLSFPCGAFAEELHNKAEVAGIKAAWVAIEFEGESPGHALNAFHTTDRGLVWIDSSGSWFEPSLQTQRGNGGADTTDKVAYLAIGKKYALASLNIASSTEYAYIERYMKGKLTDKTIDRITQEQYHMIAQEQIAKIVRYDEWLPAELRRAFSETTGEKAATREWNEKPKAGEDGRYLPVGNLERERYTLSPSWGIFGIVSRIDIYW